jgi:phosphohistidine phosphatase
MKQVIVMRHAKSDWTGGPSSDHDRPLNARGRRAAAALGDWLRREGLLPDQVLCSSSMRTRETLVRLDLPADTPTVFSRELYLAEPEEILAVLRRAEGQRVLILGHNPGIAMTAEALLRVPLDDDDFHRYPTGATLVADLDIDGWQEAGWEKANARHFVVPRALMSL